MEFRVSFLKLAKDVPRADDVVRDNQILFSESNSRFVVEIEPGNKDKFEAALRDVPFAQVGKVTDKDVFEVRGISKKKIIRERIADLKEAWQAPLRW